MRNIILVEAASTAIIVSIIGVAIPFLLWFILNVSRKLVTDRGYEIKCRRINLFDPEAYKLEIIIYNLGEKEKKFSDIRLLYKDKDELHPYAELSAPCFIYKEKGGRIIGESEIEVDGEGSICLIYAFKRIKEIGDLPLYLSYKDEKGKTHFAQFEKDAYYSQLLTFRKRKWKIE